MELSMNQHYELESKKILIVDDEPDVLDSLSDLLENHQIDTAGTFESGKKCLERETYDIAILDIMGVRGFDLLKIAQKVGTPAMVLTANAITPEGLKLSADNGAVFFVPKDKMIDIETYLFDIFSALEQDTSPWEKWFGRLAGFFDKRFNGPDWREKEKSYWQNKIKTRF